MKIYCSWSCNHIGCSVGIVQSVQWPDCRLENELGFDTLQEEDIFLFLSVKNSSGIHPASSPTGTWGSFHTVQWLGHVGEHSPSSSANVKKTSPCFHCTVLESYFLRKTTLMKDLFISMSEMGIGTNRYLDTYQAFLTIAQKIMNFST